MPAVLRYNLSMKRSISIMSRYYRARSNFYKKQRMLFPSPAEVRLIQLMGGRTVTLPFIRHPRTGFPLTKVVTMGRIFNNQFVRREVRVGSKYVDFGNDIRRGIEVDGREYHNDIVKQIERDEYFQKYDWRVLHLAASDIYYNPAKVQRQVIEFLTD